MWDLNAVKFGVEAAVAEDTTKKGVFSSSKTLITRFTYGSVVDEIDDNHVRQIAIPLLKNSEIQQKINDLALEANEKRYEAYLLEQEALNVMDKEVIYAH